MAAEMTHASTIARYLPIDGYPGYILGDDGTVWSLWWKPGYGGGHVITETPRLRKYKWPVPGAKIKRYPQVALAKEGKNYWHSVHTLVLETFVGPKPSPEMQSRHLDGDRFNFDASNLVWGTTTENQADKERHGTCQRGSKHGRAKLDEAKVLALRARRAAGERFRDLAEAFGISESIAQKICWRQLWRHV